MPARSLFNLPLLGACLSISCLAGQAQQCPQIPQYSQCDPGDGTSCSTDIWNIPPYNQINGPWLYTGLAECCGQMVPAVVNVGPEGCYSAELKTPASRRYLLALMQRDDVFVLTCTNDVVRYIPIPPFRVFKPRIPSFELPIRIEFPGE